MKRGLWLLYALFVLYGGTIPFHFNGDLASVGERLSGLPLNPLVSPDTGHRLSIPDVVQNVLLYLPFGVLGVLAGMNPRRARRIVFVTAAGTAVSILVETLQLLTSDRVSSLGDVLANSTGAFIGAAAAVQVARFGEAGLGRLKAEGLGDTATLRPFAVAALLAAIAMWQPFDVTLETGTVVSKVRGLERDWWQFTGWRDEGLLILVWAFFTMTLASYLSALGESREGRKAAAIGIGVAAMLEATQILIGSRMPGLWDVAISAAGACAGAAMWSGATRVVWPALWLGAIIGATAAAAAMLSLSPFEISPSYHTFGWFPMLGYYSRTTFETLSHVCELMIVFVPLGFWLGQRPATRARITLLATGLVFAIAAPIEALQGWIVGRYPDVSDIAVGVMGAVIGVMAARPAATPYNGRAL